MKAIYRGRLYTMLGDSLSFVSIADDESNKILDVSYGDPDLIVDPTDDQINNLVPDDAPVTGCEPYAPLDWDLRNLIIPRIDQAIPLAEIKLTKHQKTAINTMARPGDVANIVQERDNLRNDLRRLKSLASAMAQTLKLWRESSYQPAGSPAEADLRNMAKGATRDALESWKSYSQQPTKGTS